MQITDLRLLTSRKKLIFNEKPTPIKYELATIPACNFRSLFASRDPQIDRVLDKARRFQQSHRELLQLSRILAKCIWRPPKKN